MKKYIILFLLFGQLSAQYIINDKSQLYYGVSSTMVNIDNDIGYNFSIGLSDKNFMGSFSYTKLLEDRLIFTATIGKSLLYKYHESPLSINLIGSFGIQPSRGDEPYPKSLFLAGIQSSYKLDLREVQFFPTITVNKGFKFLMNGDELSMMNNGYYQIYDFKNFTSLIKPYSVHIGLSTLFKIQNKKIVINCGYKIENVPNFQLGLSYLFNDKK